MNRLKSICLLLAVAMILGSCATKLPADITLPCSVAETDSLYIREVGVGINIDLQAARWVSLVDAKMRIFSRFFKSVSSSDTLIVCQTNILPFEKECEKVFFKDNKYHVYTRIASPIPDEERLVFYREKFRKYAEEKQKRMLELIQEDQSNGNVDDSVRLRPIYEERFREKEERLRLFNELDSINVLQENNNQ